ncbi:hypothetical protein [Paenibacillus sp. URB8-2]|nr:hypothetical protein [Paenibacillus sp. URB8-2]BCG59724.1 hypothetical protein PUR_31490 [Paenibacillus sp. URB8-2]
MDTKIDIIAAYIMDHYGVNFNDRYMSPASVHNYVFEGHGERFIWQTE